jgi:hypothetical protein
LLLRLMWEGSQILRGEKALFYRPQTREEVRKLYA